MAAASCRAVLVCLGLLSVGLAGAGCLGPDAYVREPRPEVRSRFDAATGGLHGVVVAATYEPLAGALVTLVGAGRAATADLDGSFVFDFVAPGTYPLAAAREGFDGREKTVRVDAGESLFVFFVLEPSLDRRPRAEVVHRSAYVACGLGLAVSTVDCGAADDAQEASVDVPVGANVTEVEVAASWNRTGPAGTGPGLGNASLRFTVVDGGGQVVDAWSSRGNETRHRTVLAPGRAADAWRLDVAPAEGDPGDAWREAAGPVVGVRVEMEITLAYHGYALPGAAAAPAAATD